MMRLIIIAVEHSGCGCGVELSADAKEPTENEKLLIAAIGTNLKHTLDEFIGATGGMSAQADDPAIYEGLKNAIIRDRTNKP